MDTTPDNFGLAVVNYVDHRVTNHLACTSLAGHPDYCAPYAYEAEADRLLHNRGDGTFEDTLNADGKRPRTDRPDPLEKKSVFFWPRPG